MTPLYKVATTHTRQVLKDFIKFTYKIKNPQTGIKLYTLAGCFFVLAASFRGRITEMSICIAIGGVIFLFSLFRHKIAYHKLSKRDQNFIDQSEIIFSFGMGAFTISTKGDPLIEKSKYSEITDYYKDKRNYYIWVNNEDLHVLPFSDFKLGDVHEFNVFLKGRTGKEVSELIVPLKEQIKRMIESAKLAEKQHDQRIAEKKNKG
jgi:hypothetical protein